MINHNIPSHSFKCNKVDHNELQILAVCINKACSQPIPCCMKCMTEDHKNHEIIDVNRIKDQIDWNLNYLDQLAQLSESILNFCDLWKKQMEKNIKLIKDTQQISTLTHLVKYAQKLRESNNRLQYEELISTCTNQLIQIKVNLDKIQSQTTTLLNNEQYYPNQQNQWSVMINQSSAFNKIILNPDSVKFTLIKQLEVPKMELGIICISKDGNYFVSAQYKSIILWDAQSNEKIKQYSTQFDLTTALQFSNDNSLLAVGSWYVGIGQTIEIFDLTHLEQDQAKMNLKGYSDIIQRIVFTEDSQYLISTCQDKFLRIWNLYYKVEIRRYEFQHNLNGLAYSSIHKLIGYCDDQGFVHLFDCRDFLNLKLIAQWKVHFNNCLFVGFIKNESIIISSCSELTRFWNVNDILKKQFIHFKEIEYGGWTVRVCPIDDPQVIVNCQLDLKILNIWNYNSNELIQQIKVIGRGFKSFDITSDFLKIITVGWKDKVNIFEQIKQ